MILCRMDGLPVERTIFTIFYRRARSAVVAQAVKETGCTELPADFWQTEGQEAAKHRALQLLLPYACAARVLEETGLFSPLPTQATLLAAWEAHNLARQRTAASGGAVYGPVQTQLAEYLDYVFRQAVLRGQGALGRAAWEEAVSNRLASCEILLDRKNWMSFFPESTNLSGAN